MRFRSGSGRCFGGLESSASSTLLVGRFLSSLLFGVTPSDPPTLAVVAAVTLAAALLAAWLPARRAARAPVLDALRHE